MKCAPAASSKHPNFYDLIIDLYRGDRLSRTADQMADFIQSHPCLDEACWQTLDQAIRSLLRNRRIPSDLSSLNNLLGVYLKYHPMDVPSASYDIAAFCFFCPNVIRGGAYDLSVLTRSEACKVLLELAVGDEAWELRDIYQDLKSRNYPNSEIYANFAFLRLGTLLCHKDNVSQEFYDSLPKGIGSGWSAKRRAINNLWLIYLRFITCGGWAQTEVFGKAHYNIHSSRGTMTCDADAIYLCEALFYYGVLPKRRAMQYLDFSEEEQKEVSLGRIHAFSEVKAQKRPR